MFHGLWREGNVWQVAALVDWPELTQCIWRRALHQAPHSVNRDFGLLITRRKKTQEARKGADAIQVVDKQGEVAHAERSQSHSLRSQNQDDTCTHVVRIPHDSPQDF